MTITVRWRDGRSMTALTASQLLERMIQSNPIDPKTLPTEDDRRQYRQDVTDRIFTLYGFTLDADESDTDSEFFEALHRSGVADVIVE